MIACGLDLGLEDLHLFLQLSHPGFHQENVREFVLCEGRSREAPEQHGRSLEAPEQHSVCMPRLICCGCMTRFTCRLTLRLDASVAGKQRDSALRALLLLAPRISFLQNEGKAGR